MENINNGKNDLISIVNNSDRIPVFVDLNNLLYRSYFVFTPDRFKTSQGIPSGHLFGLCQTLRTLDKLNYEVFLCEDSPCDWRKTLNENYKSNRDHSNNTNFWKDFQKIRDLISNLNHFHTIAGLECEADDLMFTGAKICSELNRKCYIFSTDKDLLQTLDENISIIHKVTLKGNEEITLNSPEYIEKFPVEPFKLPYYRAFKGDTSDNIEPPVKRMPKDLILDLVDYLYEHDNFKGYIIKKKSHEKWLKQLVDNFDKYIANYTIMRLRPVNFTILQKSKLNSYEKICKEYELNQFYSYIKSLESI